MIVFDWKASDRYRRALLDGGPEEQCGWIKDKHPVLGLTREARQPVRRFIGVVGAVVFLMFAAGVGPAGAESDVARTPGKPSPSAQDWDSRCNNIRGSDLCLSWWRDSNHQGEVEIFYRKESGPKRYIRLYVALCGHAKLQVYEGYIEPRQTRAGAWDGPISPGSCWVGYMRIGNRQWTTGELRS